MTVGQRIAQKRRELGLSQEELGERLGVSRQAIYKWEADQTLPEIEKLVNLSKLFSVPVGWLLGVEEEPSPDSGGELTGEQLKMVEEIAKRYIDAIPQPEPAPEPEPPQKRRRWPFVLAALVLVAVFWHLFGRLDGLGSQYNSLQYSIGNISDSVNREINGIASRVESILEAQNTLVADWKADHAPDYRANEITFTLRVVPRTYEEGMTAIFVLESAGARSETPVEPGADHAFSGEVTCPLTDDIRLSAVFVLADGTRQTQLLEQYSYLYSSSLPDAYIYDSLWMDVRLNDTLPATDHISYSVNTTVCAVTDVRCGLFRDNELVMWYESGTEPVNGGDGGTSSQEPVFSRPQVTLERGHVYCEALVITDEYGRERVYPGHPISWHETTRSWDFYAPHGVITVDNDPAHWSY